MGGGLMQLVAMGAQDVFLTGNPQITFFKVVYRRHTNFSKECIRQGFNNSVGETGSIPLTCTLARNGDLVQEVYLNATIVPHIHNQTVNSTSIISFYNTYVLSIPGANLSTGDVIQFNMFTRLDENLLFTPGIDYTITTSGSSGYTFTYGSSLTQVNIFKTTNIVTTLIQCKADNKLIIQGTNFSVGTIIQFNKYVRINTNLVFNADSAEEVPMDYYISRVWGIGDEYEFINTHGNAVLFALTTEQKSQGGEAHIEVGAVYDAGYDDVTANNLQISVDGNFTVSANDVADNYVALTSDNLIITQIAPGFTNVDLTKLIETAEIEIGGQKIDKHYSAWFDIYNELFETNPDYNNLLSTPTNVTTNDFIIYLPLRFWFNRNAGLALPLIALQYHEVKVLITLNPNFMSSISVMKSITIRKADLLVNYIYLDTDERRRFAQVSHEYLIEQVQHTGIETIIRSSIGRTGNIDLNFNHPVKALFWTTNGYNYLDNVKIQLNGHDRFTEQSSDYFHLVQPYECGLGHYRSLNRQTRMWGSVVNIVNTNPCGMYSFCLKPREHQPSGSCNFSRIDNARLSYISGVDTTNDNVDDNLHLFALNYNVLRIMSGMGGLTYSN
jgi:hypothetical protein